VVSTRASVRTSRASKDGVAIGTLVRRFPNIELATDEPEWNGRIVLRGLSRLPLAIGS